MRKYLFLLLAVGTAAACTTQEQNEQIQLFWAQQLMQLMPQAAAHAMVPPLPNVQSEIPSQVETEIPATPLQPATDSQSLQAKAVNKTTTARTPARRPQSQFMEITMEDSSRVNKFKSNAPFKERQDMQRAIENVKQSNQQTLQDIGTMFDGDTQAQAFAIVSKSEKILLRAANVSMSYPTYLNAQRKILQEQEQQLNQLMKQNAYKLNRRIRG